MKRKKTKSKAGFAYVFHGSFARKALAAAKEKTRKGAFIITRMTNRGFRYIVMTPKK
jgi:hypothetical protein